MIAKEYDWRQNKDYVGGATCWSSYWPCITSVITFNLQLRINQWTLKTSCTNIKNRTKFILKTLSWHFLAMVFIAYFHELSMNKCVELCRVKCCKIFYCKTLQRNSTKFRQHKFFCRSLRLSLFNSLPNFLTFLKSYYKEVLSKLLVYKLSKKHGLRKTYV